MLLTSSEDSATVGARLEATLADRYARDVPITVRTPEELASVLERLPFRGDAYDERRLQVAFLAGAPPASTQPESPAPRARKASSMGAKPSSTIRTGWGARS